MKLPHRSRRTWIAIAVTCAAIICAVAAALVIPTLIRTNLKREPFVEGVYLTADEMSGFSGTILELKDGQYRYWFYSDVGDSEPGPQTGTYEVKGGQVIGRFGAWTIGNAGGQNMLWRSDALNYWEQDGRIYDYGILIRADVDVPDNWWEVERPSIAAVYEALGRPYSDWNDPFVFGPQ